LIYFYFYIKLECAMIESVFGKEKDLFFMDQALKQANKAFDLDEVPVGAVVVNTMGEIISYAHNRVENDCTQRSHAEALAIEGAGRNKGDWRLENCWLYVTLEPCSMCMGLIRLSRLAGIVYGAHSPLFGFRLDKLNDLWVYKRDAFIVIQDVRSAESAQLLKKFFQKKRNS
jgi:tRNA(adenine34) deaminase